jgi:hypothetical protein
MKRAILIIVIFFASCSGDENVEDFKVLDYSDSIIIKSKSIQDSASKTLLKADKLTEDKVIRVVNQVNKANEELNNLKSVMRLTKEIVIHDTIYITEKKNFWGKTKITIDSSKSTTEVVDSSFNEKEN